MENAIILAAIAGWAWLFYNKPQGAQASGATTSYNLGAQLPSYIDYNYPNGFTGGQIPITQGAIGDGSNAPAPCAVCSLFPFTGGTQY